MWIDLTGSLPAYSYRAFDLKHIVSYASEANESLTLNLGGGGISIPAGSNVDRVISAITTDKHSPWVHFDEPTPRPGTNYANEGLMGINLDGVVGYGDHWTNSNLLVVYLIPNGNAYLVIPSPQKDQFLAEAQSEFRYIP